MTTIDELARDNDGIIINGTPHTALLCGEIAKAFEAAAASYGKAAELPLASTKPGIDM